MVSCFDTGEKGALSDSCLKFVGVSTLTLLVELCIGSYHSLF